MASVQDCLEERSFSATYVLICLAEKKGVSSWSKRGGSLFCDRARARARTSLTHECEMSFIECEKVLLSVNRFY